MNGPAFTLLNTVQAGKISVHIGAILSRYLLEKWLMQ